jgi:hypothetical protein
MNDFLWHVRIIMTSIVSLMVSLGIMVGFGLADFIASGLRWPFDLIVTMIVAVGIMAGIWVALMCDDLFYREKKIKRNKSV